MKKNTFKSKIKIIILLIIIAIIVSIIVSVLYLNNLNKYVLIYSDKHLVEAENAEAKMTNISWIKSYSNTFADDPVSINLSLYPQFKKYAKEISDDNLIKSYKVKDAPYGVLKKFDGKNTIIIFNKDLSFIKEISLPIDIDSYYLSWIGDSYLGLSDKSTFPNYYVVNVKNGESIFLKPSQIINDFNKNDTGYNLDIHAVSLPNNEKYFLLNYCLGSHSTYMGFDCVRKAVAISDFKNIKPLLIIDNIEITTRSGIGIKNDDIYFNFSDPQKKESKLYKFNLSDISF